MTVAGAALMIAAVPELVSPFRLNLIGKFTALALLALSLGLVWGYAGILSLGHGVFFGLGGYAMGMHLKLVASGSELPDFMFYNGLDAVPWWWEPFRSLPFALVMTVAAPMLVALAVGWLTFRNRIRGVYFSILTQAMCLVAVTFFIGQQPYTGGTNGLTDFSTLAGFALARPETQRGLYFVSVLALAAALGLCRLLTTGRFGLVLRAIRDGETRVRFSGYDPDAFKLFVFVVSAGMAGLAGALFVPQVGIISPAAMGIVPSIEIAIWVAVGGRGTLVGPIAGAFAVNWAKSYFSESFPGFWLYLQGLLFILVVLFLPRGLAGALQRLAARPTRIARYGAPAAVGTPEAAGTAAAVSSDPFTRASAGASVRRAPPTPAD